MTKTETILWARLKGKQLYGYKFRRQYSVGNYIVDFYCPKVKLAIEIDGSQHNEKHNMIKDDNRTKLLNEYDIIVIRFWNHEVLINTDEVVNAILFKIKQLND